MKKIFAVLISVLVISFIFCSCRTVNDTKPKNETTNPKATVQTIVL
ncbi:MAG: hypothetical protein IJJ40_04010 [Clostridia bacterium]|nr:hypothetical protein [Clostridia bacterium]